MKTKLLRQNLTKTKQQLMGAISLFCLLSTLCMGQASINCPDAILDFSQSGYHWAANQTNGDFTVEDQQFHVSIEDQDGILQDVQEAGAGLLIGTDPNTVDDYVSVIYQLSQSTSNVQFTIRDLDYKNYGYHSSNQQEAVCVYGYCRGEIVYPHITSLDGRVHISENCAEATQNSNKGHEESIQITFTECIDKIEIQYGTGNNSPVHNPTYGKIYIGEVGGILASTCNNNCTSCEDPCVDAALDFSEHGYDWHANSTSAVYTVEDQTIQISVEDPDGILEDTSEEGASIQIGIDPHTVDDVVNIRYELSETSDLVEFIIRDLDYKHYGAHRSNQQEQVCVFGYRNGEEVLPIISLIEGSVKIEDNCAIAMDDSRNGKDESIKIRFDECIDEVLIIYGNGPDTPVSNPTYSKIYIGDEFGFFAGYCEDTCIDCQLVVYAGEDQSICSNGAIELSASAVGFSSCGGQPAEVTYLWSTRETTPIISVQESGTYTVTVTDCNGCQASNEVNISITPDPDANAGDDVLICEGETVALTATGGLEYTWSNGETGATINVSPNTTTNYTVTVSNGNGCEASDEVTVTVAENPITNAGDDVAICAGGTIDLTATGGGSYVWDNGATEAVINVQPIETTTYSVMVTSNDGCLGTDEVTVTVNPNPEVTVESLAICEGQEATLSANSIAVGAVDFVWNNGETTPDISGRPAITTEYSVTITDANGCTGNASATVTVNPNPVVTVENVVICEGQTANLSATGFAIGAADFSWDNGESSQDIAVNPSETTDYMVTITDTNACNGSATATVTVNPNPAITVNDAVICLGDDASLIAEGGETYSWDAGFDGPEITISPETSTPYIVTGTDANGCSSTAVANVTVNTNPLASVDDAVICEGASVTLNAFGGTTYAWASGETTANIMVSPGLTTDYTVTVTDNNGCTDTAIATVTVNPNPAITVNDAVICVGDDATLTAEGGVTYSWEPVFSGQVITVSPNMSATYMVTGTDANGCNNTATSTVTVNQNPTAAVNDAVVCDGASATLTASGGTSYSWDNGETTESIMLAPSSNESYTVTVTDDNGCTDMATASVTVNPNPTAAVNDAVVCDGASATLTASGGTSYSWDNGETSESITLDPAVAGSYTVTVTDDNGCTDMATASVTVNPNPTAVVNDAVVCDGASATLTASGGTSYSWDNGETTEAITLDTAVTGTYTVTVTDDNGCTDMATASVTVNPNPTAAVNDAVVCDGASAILTASGGTSYSWDNGETTEAITLDTAVTGTYTVTVTDDNGCTDMATASVTVNPNPTAAVNDAVVCDGAPATLTASGGTSYLWDNGETTESIMLAPSSNESYTVTVTDDNGCTDMATATVTVNLNPAASVNDAVVCSGESATLTASGGTSYVWESGETTASITLDPAVAGSYTVTVTDDNGCSDMTTATITVNPNPTAIVNDVIVCEGEPATLTASGGTLYAWEGGETTESLTIDPAVSGTYLVTVTDDNGCSDMATASISVNPNPTAGVNSATICEGEAATLTATGGTSFEWGNGAMTATIDVAPSGTLDFIVTVTDDNGCSDSATTTVTVNPSPAAAIGDVTVCEGEAATLTATGGTSYLWETGETTETLTFDPAVAGTYTVTVTNDDNCSAEAQGNVIVNAPPSVSISSDQTDICEGVSVTLTASGADSYLWDNGETTASITTTPDLTSTYSVTGTNLGCSASTDITINVTNINLGKLAIDSIFCRLPTSSESIKATIAEESEFEEGFAKYYVLAYGPDDEIVDYQLSEVVNPLPKFQVSTVPEGMYSIHTFIADTTIFDVKTYLDDAVLNRRTIDETYSLTIEGGGDLCAKIDREGAQTELKFCRLGSPMELAFEIFPNPAKEILYFKNISLENLVSVELSNVEGKILHRFNLDEGKQLLSLTVDDYPTGVYLLKATTALKAHTTKIVIQ